MTQSSLSCNGFRERLPYILLAEKRLALQVALLEEVSIYDADIPYPSPTEGISLHSTECSATKNDHPASEKSLLPCLPNFREEYLAGIFFWDVKEGIPKNRHACGFKVPTLASSGRGKNSFLCKMVFSNSPSLALIVSGRAR